MRLEISLLALVLFSLQFGSTSGCDPADDDDIPDPTPVFVDEAEPNDDILNANILSIGMTVSGEMYPGDKDFYRLDVPAGFQGYKLTLSAVDTDKNCFVGVDPNLELRDDDGKTQLYWVEDSTANYCPVLSFVPIAGHTYYVIVGTDYVLSGNYVLSLTNGGMGTVSGSIAYSPPPAGLSVSTRPAGHATERSLSPWVYGELLVKPAAGVTPSALLSALDTRLDRDITSLRPLLGGLGYLATLRLLSLEEGERRLETFELIRRLTALPEIVGASPNRIFEPTSTPDDPLLFQQWDLGPYPGINIESAWDIEAGDREVVVAVIDTGDDPDHEDLIGRSVPGFDFISFPDNAGDGDGVDADPRDNLLQGHGTHVAGTIAAGTNNGVGIAGIGWATRYMPLRVCGNYGCTEADIIEAIGFAAGLKSAGGPGLEEARADVVNLSLGGHDGCSPVLQDVITAASARNVIVVSAAGNSADEAIDYSPGNCLDVITVGATDTDGTLASYSNFGERLDILAPGTAILSTVPGDEYAKKNGTSMACPHIAGVVALLKGFNRDFGYDAVIELLQGPCDLGSCEAESVDAEATLRRALDRPSPEPVPSPLILIQAVEINNPELIFHTFARGNVFTVVDLAPGVYHIQAGLDLDGDFVLNEQGEAFGSSAEGFTITILGEDFGGVHIPLE